MKHIWLALLLILSSAVGAKSTKTYTQQMRRYGSLIVDAEKRADRGAAQILAAARKMVENGEIIPGSCWNWINTAYERAGYSKSRRKVIFRSKKEGPYADIETVKPGDWIYHINHSYNGIEHSGMFVAWIDKSRKTALMLSYGGEGRRQPGRYRPYDLSSIYSIIRAEENLHAGNAGGKTVATGSETDKKYIYDLSFLFQ